MFTFIKHREKRRIGREKQSYFQNGGTENWQLTFGVNLTERSLVDWQTSSFSRYAVCELRGCLWIGKRPRLPWPAGTLSLLFSAVPLLFAVF